MEVSNTNAMERAEVATDIIQNVTHNLSTLLDIIRNNTRVENDGKNVTIKNTLTNEEIYALIIQIPVECAYIQAFINSYSVTYTLQKIITDNSVTENLDTMYGLKGDAKERIRKAEKMALEEIIDTSLKKQIISCLQDTIIRADKAYEGLKKVTDARTKEWNYDKKIS